MKEIQIFYTARPKRGAFISEGHYDYTKIRDGVPAMRVKWKIPKMMGAFFSNEDRTFIFAEHATKISPDDDKSSQGAAKWGRSSRASKVPGIIGLAGFAVDVMRGATNDTSDMKGIVFTYVNDEGSGGFCWGVAPATIADEIVASVPADRIDPSILARIGFVRSDENTRD